MFQTSQWGLITEIADKVSSECNKDATFLDLDKPSLVQKVGKKIQPVKGTIGAVSEALKDTEFSPLWAETKKDSEELHKHIVAVTKYVFSSLLFLLLVIYQLICFSHH